MDPGNAVEIVFVAVILIILIRVFADVIISLQGAFWGVIFILASIAIVASYFAGGI